MIETNYYHNLILYPLIFMKKEKHFLMLIEIDRKKYLKKT